MNDYGSENSSDVIASQNCSSYNFTRASRGHSTVLTIFAILEFAIFILKLLLGCVVIYCLYRSKMLRDPVSALMTSVAASLMILSIPLNLLVGLSVLIDQPTIGSCNSNIRFLLITVLIITVSQVYLIPFSIGLIATVQFLIIKYGLKRVSTRNVYSAFALLMSFAMGFSIVHCAFALWNETITQISGLLFAFTSVEPTVLIVILLGQGAPMVITLVTSYMTYRTVKNGIVETDNDNRVTKSVLIMNVTTITTDVFSKAVIMPALVYWTNIPEDSIANMMLTLFLGVEPFYVLILFIAIHKTIRCTIVAAISDCIKSPNSVWPEPQTECKWWRFHASNEHYKLYIKVYLKELVHCFVTSHINDMTVWCHFAAYKNMMLPPPPPPPPVPTPMNFTSTGETAAPPRVPNWQTHMHIIIFNNATGFSLSDLNFYCGSWRHYAL